MRKIVFALIAVCVLLSGCQNNNEGEIIVGAILPLSGSSAAVVGEPKKQGLELAAMHSSEHGFDIKIIFEDSEGASKKGLAALNKLIMTGNVDYYYIDMTPIIYTCIPVINDKKVITFAGSAVPEITTESDYLYRLFAGGDYEVKLIVEYLLSEKIKSIYLMHPDELYGNGAAKFVKDRFREFGGEIVGEEEYPMSQTDFKSQLLKAKESKAEKIVLLGYGNEYSALLRQAHELNIPPSQFVCNLGGSNKVISDLPSDLIANMVVVGPKFSFLLDKPEQMSDVAREFVNSFKETYSIIPDFKAAYAYDMIMVLLEAIRLQEENQELTIPECIVRIKDFEGVTGKVSFLENGDSVTELVIAKYDTEGKIVSI